MAVNDYETLAIYFAFYFKHVFFFLLIKMYNTNTNYVLSVNKLFI